MSKTYYMKPSGPAPGQPENPKTKPLGDKDPFPFKFKDHKGKPMETIPATDLLWIETMPWLKQWPGVKNYINERRNVLEKEVENKKYSQPDGNYD